MYTLGIDIGSSSSKAVILKDGAELVSSAVVQVGTGTSGPARVMEAEMCIRDRRTAKRPVSDARSGSSA